MNKQKGFTLLEILIAVVILGFLAFYFMSFARDVTDSTLRFSNSLTAQQQIQQTLQIMTPEIRSASQSNNGSYPLAEASTTTLTFFSDVDSDGVFERVRYFLDGMTFKKGIIEPSGEPLTYSTSTETTRELISNVVAGAQIFSYFDLGATSTESTPLPFPVDVLRVKMVRINIVANQGTVNLPSIVGAQNQATIRNLRYKEY